MWISVFFLFVIVILGAWFSHNARSYARVDWGDSYANFADGHIRWFCKVFHGLPDTIIPLPETGPAIIVANHISGLDPFILVAASRRPLRFLIAREQFERFGLCWLFKAAGCIPVDREGRPERALRAAYEALDNGEVIALFPHGGIQWPIKKDTRIKGGAIKMAIRSSAPLFPVLISGIRLPGFTVLSLIFPGRVSLELGKAFYCDDYDAGLKQLTLLLNKI